MTAVEAHRRNVGVLSVTTTPSAWPGTVHLARGHSAIKTALGLHPQLARERKHELDLFDRYFAEARFIGEVGLDGSPEFREFWSDQVEVFEHVLQACERAEKEIISVHSRRAATHVLNCLDKFTGVRRPILHWFSGTAAELRRAVDRDCWFSVGPTMLAGSKGRSLAAAMPRDRVLLETDGPFTQLRGTVLRPWDVALACRLLSEVWGIDADEAGRVVRSNEIALLA